MHKLNQLSAVELVRLIKSKEISCEEVMRAHLTRINEVNQKLNAVVQILKPEEALAQARKADSALQRGEELGLLHGLPVTIKDACKVQGFICSKACKGLYGSPAIEDATVVKRLREQGAIILGLTNVPELLTSYETDNDLYGRANNPYDMTRTPGGSSGGEAAIIAAGGSPLGIGSDAGGSIRQPAHNTGIVGIKPTQGRVPLTGGIPTNAAGLFSQLGIMGPMARFVDDLILTLPIISGPDGHCPHTTSSVWRDPNQINLNSLRIAYHVNNTIAKPDADTRQVIQKVVKELANKVMIVEENCPEALSQTYELVWETFFMGGDKGEMIKMFLQWIGVTKPSALLQQFLTMAQQCEFSVTELRKRFFEIDQYRFDMLGFMQNYDVIICPVAATPAKSHQAAIHNIKDFTYTMSYNLTGWPAVVVRCGTSSTGLPIGVQIIAKPWQDEVALAVAKQLEKMFGGWQAPSI